MLTRQQADAFATSRKKIMELKDRKTPSLGDPPNLLTAAQKTVSDVQAFDMATDAYTSAIAGGNQDMISRALTMLDNAFAALEGDRTPVDAGFAALGIMS